MQEFEPGRGGGDRMAVWMTTGGAREALAMPPEFGDDGLAATALTVPPYCFNQGDDGLAATLLTRPPYCFGQ